MLILHFKEDVKPCEEGAGNMQPSVCSRIPPGKFADNWIGK